MLAPGSLSLSLSRCVSLSRSLARSLACLPARSFALSLARSLEHHARWRQVLSLAHPLSVVLPMSLVLSLARSFALSHSRSFEQYIHISRFLALSLSLSLSLTCSLSHTPITQASVRYRPSLAFLSFYKQLRQKRCRYFFARVAHPGSTDTHTAHAPRHLAVQYNSSVLLSFCIAESDFGC